MGKDHLVYCNYRYTDRRKTKRFIVYQCMHNGTKRFAVLQLIGRGREVVKAHFTHHVKLFYCEIPNAVLEETSRSPVMVTGKY